MTTNIPERKPEWLNVKSAGLCNGDEIGFQQGHRVMCGHIMNGVAVRIGDRYSFVIDWDSFEAAYLALKATRPGAEAEHTAALADPNSMQSRMVKYIETGDLSVFEGAVW